MLRLSFLVFLLFITNLEAQSSKSQKDWFESGQKFLKKKKFEIAASKFYLAEKYGPDTEMKKLARLKIDSILIKSHKKKYYFESSDENETSSTNTNNEHIVVDKQIYSELINKYSNSAIT